MILKLKRSPKSVNGAVLGTITLVTDTGVNYSCYTLEGASVLIPANSYRITLYNSPHRGYCVPLLHGIPNRDYIEIHIGNTIKDTQGCILVGKEKGPDYIGQSRKAFAELMEILGDCEDCILQIE